MEMRFTIDEILIIFKKLCNLYGLEKIEQLLYDENTSLEKSKEKTPTELLDEINNY